MNLIEKIAFHFSGESEEFFRTLYGRWDTIWMNRLEKSTDRILKKHNNAAYTIELGTLELELDPITENDFEDRFLTEYEDRLENALLKQLYENPHKLLRKLPTQERLSELLFRFLLHGSLPWNIEPKYKDINLLFLEVAQRETGALRHFFRTYGHYTGLQQRLVFQLNETALEEGIRAIAPGENRFIISYIRFVQSKYAHIRTPQMSRTPYHKTVWQVVYAYLLTNRSSFFDKKSFLQQTIRQLAIRNNIPYTKLLFLLLLKPEDQPNYPVELLLLLTTLKKEEEQSTVSKSGGWLKLYEIVKTEDAEKMRYQNPEQKRILLSLLKHEDTNFRFLQLLKEPEILTLVEWVIPRHHRFVKTYAKTLDRHKDKGLLQGKAGSEFRLVKWQIIFPVLLENNRTGFDQYYFVLRVLQKVASRYNLKLLEILHYIHVQNLTTILDNDLIVIFNDLYKQFNPKNQEEKTYPLLNISEITATLRKPQALPAETDKQWKLFLAEETRRHDLLRRLSEMEHRQLVRVLYRHNSSFILSYADALEQQKNTGLLQGKTSGNFRFLKWQFIHDVLLEPSAQVFNKKYLVEKVIRKMAAHHNLKAEELLVFFYLQAAEKGFGIPFDLFHVLETLYIGSDKKNRQKTIPNITQPSEKKQIEEKKAQQRLIGHFGKDERLVSLIDALALQPDFIRYMEPVLQTEARLRHFLFTRWNITIPYRQILVLLLRIARSYKGSSRTDILLKIILLFSEELKTDKQRRDFERYVRKTSESNILLKETLNIITELPDEMDATEDITLPEPIESESSFIPNAGLVLLAPFLPRLFSMLKLTEDGNFLNQEDQIKAIFLLQHIIYGSTDFPEHELLLNKLLTGFQIGTPLPHSVILTDEETQTTESLLEGVIQHWNKVKTTAGLREGFLQREGKLENLEEYYWLTVEEKAYDMLLDGIPWSFKTIKFSWMEKPIQVSWR